MIYFDNAATTFQKPPAVFDAVLDCLKNYCGNPGRSAHPLSLMASEKIYETREAMANFLNTQMPESVVFTLNATYALNIAIKSTLSSGDHAIISDVEHNAVLRPIEKLKSEIGVTYSVFDTDGDVRSNIEALIRSETKCIISSAVSNVTGKEIPLDILSELAKKHSLTLIVDAAQMIGHKRIDLKQTPIDILCAPSHKALFGIQGAGFCVFKDKGYRPTLIEGGSGSESLKRTMPEALPERFEAGTLPTPAIISLLGGIDYILGYGIDSISERIDALTVRCREVIEALPGYRLVGAENGIVSFVGNDAKNHVIAERLSNAGIYVRSGFHCAPLVHKKIGTQNSGTVRVSFSVFNKCSEIDVLYKELKLISKT